MLIVISKQGRCRNKSPENEETSILFFRKTKTGGKPRPAVMAFDPSSRTPIVAPDNQLKPPDKKTASLSLENDDSKIMDAKT